MHGRELPFTQRDYFADVTSARVAAENKPFTLGFSSVLVLRALVRSREQRPALGGEAILLEAAPRLVGDRALD